MSEKASGPSKAKKLVLVVLLLLVAVGAVGYQLFPFAKEWWEEGDSGPLPSVDLEEMVGRLPPATAAYYRTVEAQALSTYRQGNWWHIRSYSAGREAIRIFICQQVGGDPYCEGLLQKSDCYARRAYSRGSRDALIRTICDVYYYQDHYSNNTGTANEVTDRALDTARSNYPAICKVVALSHASNNLATASGSEPGRRMGPALARLPALCDELVNQYGNLVASGAPGSLLFRASGNAEEFLRDSPESLRKVGEGIDQAFGKHSADGATRTLCFGNFYISWAWAARGSGWADSVTHLGWQLMGERLKKAREILTEAMKTYPDDARMPALLITVELGDGGNREAMEKYFQRSIQLDPNYYKAYYSKSYFLQPRWHGSVRDVVEFGLQCVKTGRWDASIPLVFVEALALVADQQEQIYEAPQIWKAVSTVYEEFLKRYPHSSIHRTHYLKAAVMAKQWPIVRNQIDILGDNWDRYSFSDDEYNKIRREAAAHR